MSLSYYDTIDEFLGNRDTRYFGSGYVNTAQVLSDFELAVGDEAVDFSGTGAVVLPELWSAKGSRRQKPHLSSIDAIEFAVACLARVVRSIAPEREFSVELIKKLDVVAGKEPVEEELGALALKGRVSLRTAGLPRLEMTISNMKVSLQFSLDEPTGLRAAAGAKQAVRISDLMLNQQNLNASAVVSPERQDARESWSLSSCFAAALQLGQVLLYKLDSVSRESSSTLWMRKTSIGVSPGVPALGLPQPIYTRLDNVKRLTMDGADWRCADISSLMCNTRIVCSVAHRI
jgi:hypothetical protein